MSFLDSMSATVGEEIDRLAGYLMTRLTAQAQPVAQVARATGTLTSADGINVSLDSGTFPAGVVPGTILQVLGGPLAGAQATIQSGGAGTSAAVLDAPGLGGAVTSVSWEVLQPADDEVQVESTLYFQDAGDFYLGGVRYRYTGRTATTFTGLTHWDGEAWVAGVRQLQEPLDVVIDYSRRRTALDRLRRSFFVEYAEGEDLAVLGANRGKPQPTGLADDTRYRAYLRATMYGARGTRLYLYQVLDAIVGPGAWEAFEDFTSPTEDLCRVFVRRTTESSTDLNGRALLDGEVLRPATSTTTVDLAETPDQVGSVLIAPDTSYRVVEIGSGAETADGITITAPAATFSVRIRIGDLIQVLDGPLAGTRGRVLSRDSDTQLVLGRVAGHPDGALTGPSPAFQWRVLREVTDCRFEKPSADVALEWPGDGGTQAWEWMGTATEAAGALIVSDGTYGDRLAVGGGGGLTAWYRRQARIIADSRAVVEFLTGPAPDTIDSDTDGLQACYEIHDGTRAIAVGWFHESTSQSRLGFCNATTGAALGTPTLLSVFTEGYRAITIEKRGTSTVVLKVNGEVIETAAYTAFVATTDRELRFGCRSTANPAFMNVRHVAWYVDTEADFWAARSTAATTAGDPSRDVGGLGGILQAGDVGKVLWLRGGLARNPAGGTVNGEWEVETFGDANTATLIGRSRPGATFRRGHPSRVFLPAEYALQFPDALGHELEILEGPHAGTYPIDVLLRDDFSDMSLREDGQPLDSLPVASEGGPTVYERSAIVEVTGAPAGGFTASDGEFAWRIVPVFPADTGLLAELSDAGSSAAATLTLRQALPITTPLPVLAVSYSTVDSAHTEALVDRNDATTPRWPFYLYDAWGLLRPILLDAAAEGIEVNLDALQRDAAGLHVVLPD